jgi:hypothetical protein
VAGADDIIISGGAEVHGVFLEEPMGGDRLGSHGVEAPATFAIFAEDAEMEGGRVKRDRGRWWDAG